MSQTSESSPGTIAIHAMTRKGFIVVQSFLETHGPERLECVIGDNDATLQNDWHSELRNLCAQNGVPFFHRKDRHQPKAAWQFAISWRFIIEAAGTLIVLHDSPLPRYRGFAPMLNMLINGEDSIGVTALLASKEYDRGDIIDQRTISIQYPMTIGEAIGLSIPLYCELVNEIAAKILAGQDLVSRPQKDEEATYSLWRNEDDFTINWSMDASHIRRHIDALSSPYKGASTFMEGRKLRVFKVIDRDDVHIENRDPGKVIFMENGNAVIVCGKGLLTLIDVRDDETGERLSPFPKFKVRLSNGG